MSAGAQQTGVSSSPGERAVLWSKPTVKLSGPRPAEFGNHQPLHITLYFLCTINSRDSQGLYKDSTCFYKRGKKEEQY
jgi:hypothetical protein